jgi:hypothetical protein
MIFTIEAWNLRNNDFGLIRNLWWNAWGAIFSGTCRSALAFT